MLKNKNFKEEKNTTDKRTFMYVFEGIFFTDKEIRRFSAFLSKWLSRALLMSALIVLSSTTWVLVNKSATADNTADCAVIFGAAIWPGEQPSHALEDRIMAGITLFQEGKVSCLIFSGADTEPDVMQKVALQNNIPEDVITLDHQGLNTLATLRNLDTEKSYILVSNDFHLGRIKLLAWKLDLEFQTHAATYLHGRLLKEPFFILREVLGTIWYTIRVDI